MRIAVVSDIHGNLTAFEAVLRDLRESSPDLVLHGGDLAHGGSRPAVVIDRIRDLGWEGVLGNADELLPRPERLTDFARPRPQLRTIFDIAEAIAAVTREDLGGERIAWLDALPMVHLRPELALVHASPGDTWVSPGAESSPADLEAAYGQLGRPLTVYGHIHHGFRREVAFGEVVNTGSVSLSYDGDPRASYLLVDDGVPTIRRVGYDIEREVKAILDGRMPGGEWFARMLRTGRFEMPQQS